MMYYPILLIEVGAFPSHPGWVFFSTEQRRQVDPLILIFSSLLSATYNHLLPTTLTPLFFIYYFLLFFFCYLRPSTTLTIKNICTHTYLLLSPYKPTIPPPTSLVPICVSCFGFLVAWDGPWHPIMNHKNLSNRKGGGIYCNTNK